MFLYWPWYRFDVSCIGPRPVGPRANTADRESIRNQYRNNQLITPLFNNSTYVVYTTNIRPAKMVLYGPYHFHMVFEFQIPMSLCMSRWNSQNYRNPTQSSQFPLQIDARFVWLLHLWKPQTHCQRQPCQTTCL